MFSIFVFRVMFFFFKDTPTTEIYTYCHTLVILDARPILVPGYNGQRRDWRTIAAEARALPGVTSAVPLIEQPLMATYNGRIEGVLARGMHANDIRTNATTGQKVIAGSLAPPTPGHRPLAIGARPPEAPGGYDRTRAGK